MFGMQVHSPFGRQRLRITAKKSLNNPYDGKWVSVFIKGDGSEFDFGVDYYECGICKFFDIQDASEITPYLCHFDFIQQKAMNTGFFRTMTIASGDQKCDFRWKKGVETNSEWHRND